MFKPRTVRADFNWPSTSPDKIEERDDGPDGKVTKDLMDLTEDGKRLFFQSFETMTRKMLLWPPNHSGSRPK